MSWLLSSTIKSLLRQTKPQQLWSLAHLSTPAVPEVFQVRLHVQDFKKSEIVITVTGKNEITVEGKQEEKGDGKKSYYYRHFVGRYSIPEGHDVKKISSSLGEDGVLTISVPKFTSDASKNKT